MMKHAVRGYRIPPIQVWHWIDFGFDSFDRQEAIIENNSELDCKYFLQADSLPSAEQCGVVQLPLDAYNTGSGSDIP